LGLLSATRKESQTATWSKAKIPIANVGNLLRPVEFHITITVQNERVSFSSKLRGSYSVIFTRYAFYANGFWFESHLAHFPFFILYFFSGLSFTFKG